MPISSCSKAIGLGFLLSATLAACGGGSSGSSSASMPSNTSPDTGSSSTPMPVLAAKTTVLGGPAVGTTRIWEEGDTATGGQGQPAGGVNCATSVNYHIHSHLSIFQDGEMLVIPQHIGIVPGCTYDLHTHDESGEIHVEAPTQKVFTLGQFFAVWGRPLSSTNVAGITGKPVVAYINDGGNITRFNGNPADIELASHRSIILQIGSAITEVPRLVWDTKQ